MEWVGGARRLCAHNRSFSQTLRNAETGHSFFVF
jgi:hypothetical protein